MYRLYYYPLNASMAPHFVLEALGVDFELVLVDRKENAQKSAEYLKLNPAGKIPTLVDGEKAIFESAAICIHLAESNPSSKLIPSIGSDKRSTFFQWMINLTNTLQAELMVYFYPERHTPDSAQAEQIKQTQDTRISQILELIDNELSNKKYLLGDNVSAVDYFLFMLAIWADELVKPPLQFEHLATYLRRLAKDNAIIEVCKKEGVSLADYQ